MSKPWEQEWEQDPNSPDFVVDVGPRYATVAKAMALWPMDVAAHQQVTGELAKFIASAPDMARALIAIRERVAQAGDALPRPRNADEMAALEDSYVTIPTEMLRAAFAALRKAGAL